MKKLEDIPKKQVFDVPDGYFDKLPGIVQSRVQSKETSARPFLAFSLKYALPVIVLLVAGIFWFTRTPDAGDTESILASVETEALMAYLEETEMTTDDLLEDFNLNESDIEAIEAEIFTLPLDDLNFDDHGETLNIDTL